MTICAWVISGFSSVLPFKLLNFMSRCIITLECITLEWCLDLSLFSCSIFLAVIFFYCSRSICWKVYPFSYIHFEVLLLNTWMLRVILSVCWTDSLNVMKWFLFLVKFFDLKFTLILIELLSYHVNTVNMTYFLYFYMWSNCFLTWSDFL